MLKCNDCIFKKNVPGSAHFSCSRSSTGVSNVNKHGVEKGWFFFPFDYDPVWAEDCTGYISKETNFNEMEKEDLLKFLAIEIMKFKEMNEIDFEHIHEIQRLEVYKLMKEVLSLVKSIIKI